MATILLVDDEPHVVKAINRLLSAEGYTVIPAYSGKEALEILNTEYVDLCVLDFIMPEMNGLEVCRRIRALPELARLPILFLTAKSRATDTAEGLDAGADDYLKKPFEVVELPARIRALLRRAPSGKLDAYSNQMVAGQVHIHAARPEVEINGTLVKLTGLEHQLLSYLVRYAGKPVSIDRLLEDVWAYPPGVGNPNIVQVHITNLRNKLGRVLSSQLIRNVRGQGYMLDL